MRPLRLSIEGFTCFRERQAPLDFSALDLFAISGPTGAGKSSLLDAMIFALFGKVPRLRQGLGELISLGSGRAAVRLDFQQSGRQYRVFRALHRSRSTTAQVEELVDDEVRSLAEGVRHCDRVIQDILGLDYETFIRAVILPQGDFAAFLKSPASKQREILRKLLRLDVYEDMRSLARRLYQNLEVRLSEADKRLQEDFADATQATAAQLRDSIATAEETVQQLSEETAEGRLAGEALRRQHELSQEAEQRRHRWVALQEQTETLVADARRLEASARATPLVPKLDELSRLTERAATTRCQADGSAAAFTQAEEQHATAQQALQTAQVEAEEVDDLQRHRQGLERALAWIEPLQKAVEDIEKLAADHMAKWAKLQAVERQTEATGERQQALSDEHATAQEELAAVGYDPDFETRLEAVRDVATRLSFLRQEATQTGDQAATAHHALQRARNEAQQSERQRDAAAEVLSRRQGEAQKAQDALQQAERRHQAVLWRSDLADGDPCPVCGKPVDQPPTELLNKVDAESSYLPELDLLTQARQDADAAAESAQQQWATVNTAWTLAEAQVKSRDDAYQDLHRSAVAAAEEVGELAAQLQVAVGEDLRGDDAAPIEARVLDALETSGTARRRHQAASQQESKLRHRLAEIERQHERLQTEGETLKDQLSILDERLTEVRAEVESQQQRMLEVCPSGDPQHEAQDVEERLASLRGALQKATEDERRRAVALASAEQRRDRDQVAADDAQQASDQWGDEIAAALEQAGFESAEVAREAVLDTALADRLQSQQQEVRDELTVTETRLDELEGLLDGTAVGDDDLAEHQAVQTQREAEERQQRDHLASLKVSAEELQRRRTRRAELEAETSEVRDQSQAYQELQKELAGPRFQAFLLEKIFHDLVQGATQRLLELSQQRYELAFEGGSFEVVDHDNASQRRSADTLSGGETFLASLALALELSEQVQREAGALALESIFIDEGFGTLDPETLETVSSAIEALPHGGRMVGIITHLPELTQRLPWRVMVEKTPAGSRYRVEEG